MRPRPIRFAVASVRISWLLLRLGAVLGAIAFFIAWRLMDLTPLSVLTGSMDPKIPARSLIWDEQVPVATIQRGDVITVTPPNHPRVTHRVVDFYEFEGERYFITKGDANEVADDWRLDHPGGQRGVAYESGYAYRVVAHVPHLGAALQLVTAHPRARMGLIVAPLSVLLALILLAIWRPRPATAPGAAEAAPKRRRRKVVAGGTMTLTVVVASGVVGVATTFAQLADSATPAPTRVTGATLRPATALTAQANGAGIDLTWAAPTSGVTTGLQYEVQRSAGGGSYATVHTATDITSWRDASPTLSRCATYAYRVRTIAGGLQAASITATTSFGTGGITLDRSLVVGQGPSARGGGSVDGVIAPAAGSTFDVYANLTNTCGDGSVANVALDLAKLGLGSAVVQTSPVAVAGTTYNVHAHGIATRSNLVSVSDTSWSVQAAGTNAAAVSLSGAAPAVDAAGPQTAATPVVVSTTNRFRAADRQGALAPGGSYRVLAAVGVDASGLGSVVADASALSTGFNALGLTASAGLATVDGSSFSHGLSVSASNSTLVGGATPNVAVTAYDRLGNSTVTNAPVKVDATPPAVAIAAPSGSVSSSSVTAVTGSASDDYGIHRVVVQVTTSDSTTTLCSFDAPVGGAWKCPWQPVAGPHVLTATATDMAGAVTSATKSVTVTAGAPTLASTLPDSPSTSTATVVRGTAAPGATVRVYAKDLCVAPLVAEVTADGSGAFAASVVADGNTTTYFTATATSGATTSACSARLTFVHDNTGPASPAIGSSSPLSPSRSVTPTVSGTAEAGATVGIYANSACTGAALGTAVATGGAFSIPVTVTANVTSTLYATGTDALGNVGACSTTPFTYRHDGVAPAMPTTLTRVTAPVFNSLTPIVEVGLPGADTGTPVRVAFYSDASCTVSLAGTASVAANGSFPATPVTVPANATTIIRVRAIDDAGNASACSTVSVAYTADTGAPTTTASAPASFRQGFSTITGAATDPAITGITSGVAKVTVTPPTGAPCTITSAFSAWSCGWGSLVTDGSYTVGLAVDDVATNRATSSLALTVRNVEGWNRTGTGNNTKVGGSLYFNGPVTVTVYEGTTCGVTFGSVGSTGSSNGTTFQVGGNPNGSSSFSFRLTSGTTTTACVVAIA
ncbi:MAG: hypothetical protein JWM86_900 [Thermoleophilia bacterium]|nr:hypothetical protein [Thermoleophilia bacterium]